MLLVVLFLALGLPRIGAASPCARGLEGYVAPGAYAVGVRTLVVVDPARATPPNGAYPGAPSRTLTVEIWYPTDGPPAPAPVREAPVAASGGPFPVIVSSHGFLDSRNGESYVTEHLASHGYVVAAPDFPLSRLDSPGGGTLRDLVNQPGDVSVVIDSVLGELGTRADAARIGATGLSLGGSTTLLATFHPRLRDPRIRAALPIAPGGCFFTKRFFRSVRTPFLILHGEDDLLVSADANARRPFKLARGPHALAILAAGSHTGFSAFARFMNPAVHYDCIGCAAIGTSGIGGANPRDPDAFAGIGDRRDGIDLASPRCANPCEPPLPCAPNADRPALDAVRQHTLTRAVAVAFFDATLRGDAAADCFVRRRLADEAPEVTVRSRGRFR